MRSASEMANGQKPQPSSPAKGNNAHANGSAHGSNGAAANGVAASPAAKAAQAVPSSPARPKSSVTPGGPNRLPGQSSPPRLPSDVKELADLIHPHIGKKDIDSVTRVFKAIETQGHAAAALEMRNKTVDGRTPLIHAAYVGDIGIVRFFVEKKANLNAVDARGYSVIMNALESPLDHTGPRIENYTNIFNYLMGFKARPEPANPSKTIVDLNTQGKDGKTPLMLAISNGAPESIIRQIMAANVNLNAIDSKGETALFCAVRACRGSIVTLLQADRASVLVENEVGQNVLFAAAQTGSLHLINDFISAGVNPHKVDKNDRNMLSYLVRYRDKSVSERFLAETIINLMNKHKVPLLLEAEDALKSWKDGTQTAKIKACQITMNLNAEQAQAAAVAANGVANAVAMPIVALVPPAPPMPPIPPVASIPVLPPISDAASLANANVERAPNGSVPVVAAFVASPPPPPPAPLSLHLNGLNGNGNAVPIPVMSPNAVPSPEKSALTGPLMSPPAERIFGVGMGLSSSRRLPFSFSEAASVAPLPALERPSPSAAVAAAAAATNAIAASFSDSSSIMDSGTSFSSRPGLVATAAAASAPSAAASNADASSAPIVPKTLEELRERLRTLSARFNAIADDEDTVDKETIALKKKQAEIEQEKREKALLLQQKMMVQRVRLQEKLDNEQAKVRSREAELQRKRKAKELEEETLKKQAAELAELDQLLKKTDSDDDTTAPDAKRQKRGS